MKAFTEVAIKVHYDSVIGRINRLSMPDAKDRLIASALKEKTEAINALHRDGYAKFKVKGEQWILINK